MLKFANIFSTHHTTGSKCPEYKKGTLRVYNMAFCPYGHRVLLAAEAKKIPIEIVNIDLTRAPEWMSFSGVPVLHLDGEMIKESLDICEYLDKMKPDETPLFPLDPQKRAGEKLWAEKFQNVVKVIFPLFFQIFDSEKAQPLLRKLTDELLIFDKELSKRGTKFFAGWTHPGFLDYAMWPFVERLVILKMIYPGAYDFEAAKKEIPTFERWREEMESNQAVRVCFLDTIPHYKYIKNRRDLSKGLVKEIDYKFVLNS